MEAINWKDLREGHNRIHGTQYQTDKEMLEDLYKTKTTPQIGKILGLVHASVNTKMRKEGITLRPGGWKGKVNYKTIKSRFQCLSRYMQELPTKDLMELLEAAEWTINKLKQEANMEWYDPKEQEEEYGY